MGTKAKPALNDCYDKAADDEPVFTLRAKDPSMPEAILLWCAVRVADGENTWGDEKILEALRCADDAEEWRTGTRGTYEEDARA